jgi:hypothetical protein
VEDRVLACASFSGHVCVRILEDWRYFGEVKGENGGEELIMAKYCCLQSRL